MEGGLRVSGKVSLGPFEGVHCLPDRCGAAPVIRVDVLGPLSPEIREYGMKVEDAMWGPKHRRKSESTRAVQNLNVGDCKRIVHDDVKCDIRNCALNHVMVRLRKQGWKIESYHESHGVLVVKRLA